MANRSKNKKKQLETSDTSADGKGVDYPIDVWFLISEYIKPEAVGKFASICKSSCYVVQTGKFWFSLYKRYYKPVPDLPVKLRPESVVQLFGLRADVIRTLHFTYFPSLMNERSYFYLNQDPDSLVHRQCLLMWHKHTSRHFVHFYFKMGELTNRHHMKVDKGDTSNDVWNNSEEKCRILRVTCLNYAMIPLVTGLVLQSVRRNIVPGFKFYRLHLNFGNTCVPKTPTHTITLNDVLDYKVFDWWNPGYPHEDRAFYITLPLKELWDSDSD